MVPVEPVIKKRGAKMQPRADAPPGLETDGKGNVIPFAQRTREDKEKAAAASTKDPDGDARAPASMPRAQQGQGKTPRQDDPAGQQGSTDR
jgi:hypothetical protein